MLGAGAARAAARGVPHGAPAKLSQLKADIKTVALLEVTIGRFGSERAASADIYRELRQFTSWGGKGEPWKELPAILAPTPSR